MEVSDVDNLSAMRHGHRRMNDGTKPFQHSVSVIIKNDLGEFLVVKRPDDPSDDIGGMWGFPAATARPGEVEEDTARRVGRAKLGVEVTLGRRIGESTHDRGNVIVHLVDYEARIVSGDPSVPQSDDSITQYSDWKYTNDPEVVLEIARQGSQCTQIFLEDLGIEWALEDPA